MEAAAYAITHASSAPFAFSHSTAAAVLGLPVEARHSAHLADVRRPPDPTEGDRSASAARRSSMPSPEAVSSPGAWGKVAA
jgi:hypothetical protein